MTEESRIWFRMQWSQFKREQFRSPEKAEWANLVRRTSQSPENPFPDAEGVNDDLIAESFRLLDIWDARAEETLRIFRDACTNTYCRKYVSSTF